MEKDVAKACYEEKLKLLWCAIDELMSVLFAFDHVVIADYRLSFPVGFDFSGDWVDFKPDTRDGEPRCMTFSEALMLWDKDMTTKRDIDTETIEKRMMTAVKDSPEIELFIKGDDTVFIEFQFSRDPYEFQYQLFSILALLVSAGEKGDPRADLLAMKALYFASSIATRLEVEGKRRTDIPYKAGRSSWKNRVSKQDVIEIYYRVDTEGKSKNAICEAVREKLIKQEAKRGGKKREVYSVKQIGRILKPEMEK